MIRKEIKLEIACIIFTYNRSEHTRQTIEALRNNTVIPKHLFIFQDGLKSAKDKEEWEIVNRLICSVDWCPVTVIVSERNKGLAESIVSGVTKVFDTYDAVIVLEDDCVSHPLFMKYAIDCLNKYQNTKKVFSINGYAWPVNVEDNGSDAYFTGRIGSWGWATWKDRWELYAQDYRLLYDIKQNECTHEQYNVWGQDLESYLKGNIDGTCNSWAVFWALQCIKQGGYCPTPFQSLINNIGHDGSGVHCGKMEMLEKIRDWDDMKEIVLPDKVEYPSNYRKVFTDKFRWMSPEIRLKCYNHILYQWNRALQCGCSVKDYLRERDIQTIAIWGRGNICKLLLQELKDSITVENIIESCPIVTEYENIPVIAPDKISQNVQIVIVIPSFDLKRIKNLIKGEQNLIGLDELLDSLIF